MKTIKDIAIEAKVSTGTVDRVIHNRPGVSKKTKERIEALLKKYDFQRNLLASTLAFKKKYTIATLIPRSTSKKEFWDEPKRGIKAARKEIKKYGFETKSFYFSQFDLESYGRAFDEILELNPNGVLLAPFFYKTSVDFTKKLNDRQIPFVFINIEIESLQNIAFIGQNTFQSGYLSGKLLHLILQENAHIAILRSLQNVDNHRAIDSRIKGFLSYFEQENSTRTIRQIKLEALGKTEIHRVMSDELRKNPNIKGVFVPSTSAHIVAGFLESAGVQGTRLLGFDSHVDNLDYLKKGTIDFLIDQNPFEQGYVGLKILFEFLLFSKVPDKVYNSPINIVTKENADFIRKANKSEYVL